MHHSQDPLPPEFMQRFREAARAERPEDERSEDTEIKFGATGRFPGGKLTEVDEGEIQFGVACDESAGKVLIDFGTPVCWMACDAEQAIDLGQLLVRHGKRLKRRG